MILYERIYSINSIVQESQEKSKKEIKQILIKVFGNDYSSTKVSSSKKYQQENENLIIQKAKLNGF